MHIRQWNVRVLRKGAATDLGRVAESTETLARCAALSKYGLFEDEVEEMRGNDIPPRGAAIYPDEEFNVSPEAWF